MATQVVALLYALQIPFLITLGSVFSVLTPSAGAATGLFYKDSKSVFTLLQDPSDWTKHASEAGCGRGRGNDRSADIAVVEFREDGSFGDDAQLKSALACISQARDNNRNGTLVMVFVHGWRHDASWEDPHFKEFRMALLSLATREAESLGATYRRVIGIYFGWPGGDWSEFRKRYETAQRIGRGSAMKKAIQEIIRTTKESITNEELGSPVILAGHSMGALIFQTAYSSLLDAGGIAPVDASPAEKRRCSRVYEGDRVVAFPDLVLLLNSATDSQITKGIIRQLQAKRLSKRVECGSSPFRAPLFISVSSKNDYATDWLFWVAKLGRSITDGNDEDLISYELVGGRGFLCPPISGVPDYKQSWHCLRQPVIRNRDLVSINIDLPQPKRFHDPCHVRYQFARHPAQREYVPFWVFQVPPDLMDGHNDVFNGRARLLIMALVQMSGATMSVHRTYDAMFEKEVGPCNLPSASATQ